MIELVKEKSYGMKDPKLQLFKHAIMFDKFKLPKFTCSVISSKTKEYDISVFLGLNNGCILRLKLSKQKSLFHKYEEFTLFNCKDEFKHRGPVFCMISEVIEGVSVLFSGGVDGTIKFWNTDVEEQKANHYVTTIFGHKSTILSLVFSRTKNLIISSSTDMTIRVWKMKDNFDKILNPLFQNILVIKDFDLKKKKQEEKPFWINALSLKETDIVELYAGDTKGRMHFYHFIDASYIKSKEVELRGKKYVIDNFNHMKTLNMHMRTIITVVHSVFDSMIYSIGFDNNLIGFNQKTEQKSFNIVNSSKNHYTCLSINYFTQELMMGDDKGGLSFVKIFNKSEIKLKPNQNNLRIVYIQNLEIFNDFEHLLVVTEDNLEVYRVKRETKMVSVEYHDAEIIKLFVQEPVKYDKKIIEDAKVISVGFDNKIKMWDFLTMDCICVINGPELARNNMEISTVHLLKRFNLIAVGTDLGRIFFWDLNKSVYIKNDYEVYFKHKYFVSSITSTENSEGREYMMSCGHDGLILVWEIVCDEIKGGGITMTENETRRESVIGRGSMSSTFTDDLQLPNINNKKKKNKAKDRPKNVYNLKYLPQVKFVINTSLILTQIEAAEVDNTNTLPMLPKSNSRVNIKYKESQLHVLAYTQLTKEYVYSGGNDTNINIWNIEKGTHVKKLTGHKSPISCMTFDKHYLFSGASDGQILVWNTFDQTLLMTLGEPSNIKIFDVMMMPAFGILVSIGSDKKINFWKYENKEIIKTITRKTECLCLSTVNSYGKLICGTKDRTIFELDLAEILGSLNIQHEYKKFHFVDDEINYQRDESDDKIDNFKIMSSLNNKIHI